MVNEHNLPFRMREYQELMDQEILNSGDDYDKLANYPTYVIFFCNFDYYRRGLARYQFEFRDKWHPEIAAGDLRTLVVFNTKAKDYEHATEIRPFLELQRFRWPGPHVFGVCLWEIKKASRGKPNRKSCKVG